MRKTLKVLSALLSYPTAELQGAIAEMRRALDQEARLPQHNRERLDRILEEIATGDLYDLQERYVLLFDRTRSLSLHLFEHVHGESRDRGQAMVDLKALYESHGLFMSSTELPDHLPLFLEFLSAIPEAEACDLLGETSHVLEAIRQRLKKRKSAYSSIFSCAQVLAEAKPQTELVAAMLNEPHEDPNDLAALDAAWEEEEVTFGPAAAAAAQCGKDGLASKMRAARRPAPDMPVAERKHTVVTTSTSNRA
jgi:nitrate reductase molybdenum cofactor assembly chaperone NarJ/NarW